MTMPTLIHPRAVAARYDLPFKALLRVARKHGFLIRVGNEVRLRADEVGELLDKCRENGRERASTKGAREPAHTGSSATPEASKSRPAQAAVKTLRERLQNTSGGETAPVVRLPRRS